MQSDETSEWLNPQDAPAWKRSQRWKLQSVNGEVYPSLCALYVKKKKKKSPDSSVNAIAAAFVVEMRCKDGH